MLSASLNKTFLSLSTINVTGGVLRNELSQDSTHFQIFKLFLRTNQEKTIWSIFTNTNNHISQSLKDKPYQVFKEQLIFL